MFLSQIRSEQTTNCSKCEVFKVITKLAVNLLHGRTEPTAWTAVFVVHLTVSDLRVLHLVGWYLLLVGKWTNFSKASPGGSSCYIKNIRSKIFLWAVCFGTFGPTEQLINRD